MRRWGYLPNSIELRRRALDPPPRVLVFPPLGLGDFVVSLAALRPLSEYHPGSRFHFAAPDGMRPLFEAALGNRAEIARPDEKAAFPLALVLRDEDVTAGPYARLFSACGSSVGSLNGERLKALVSDGVLTKKLRKPRHEALRYSRLLLPFGIAPSARLADCIQYCRLDRPGKRASYPDRYVVLHPFSNGHAREWPVRSFVELGRQLAELGYTVMFTGSKEEGDRLAVAWPAPERFARVQDMTGRLGLAGLIDLLSGADLVVAASTGPLHIAAALGVRTLGLYPARKGVNPERWLPIGTHACALQVGRCEQRRCGGDACACMSALTAEAVTDLLSAWLGSGADLPSDARMPKGFKLTSAISA